MYSKDKCCTGWFWFFFSKWGNQSGGRILGIDGSHMLVIVNPTILKVIHRCWEIMDG